MARVPEDAPRAGRVWRRMAALHRPSDEERCLLRADEAQEGRNPVDHAAVFAERDPALVRELYRLACEQVDDFCPKEA